jgi:hypothetical protein
MHKLMLFLAALAVLGVAGVAGAAKPPTVTISASRPAVVYGGTVRLSGKVSSQAAGENVLVMAKPYGSASFTQLDVVTTTSGGVWKDQVSPQIKTSYEAQWGTATSAAVTVKVRPQIVLTLVSRTAKRGTFSVQVNGARSFAGKRVLVERLVSSGVIAVKHVTLDSSSSATFSIRLPIHRARVRVVMPVSQAAPGYLAGYSNVWRSS